MTRFGYTLAILASTVLASACTDDVPTENTPPPGSTSGDENSTFDHDNDYISPWELLDRLTKEGPPRYTSHVHSCSKVRYKTLGNVLSSLGVNVANTTALSAGDLYRNGFNALGGANYANRIRENINITTSGASKEFDIFAAAADEIQTAFTNGTIARCPGAQLFDTANTCRPEGISCLIGTTATSRHLDYCNLTVSSASTATVGKRLAVAAMLAAAYTCE
ncbi:MAG TPA: hypothetical protein VIV40_32185 [Kofleriaceae bacterium]